MAWYQNETTLVNSRQKTLKIDWIFKIYIYVYIILSLPFKKLTFSNSTRPQYFSLPRPEAYIIFRQLSAPPVDNVLVGYTFNQSCFHSDVRPFRRFRKFSYYFRRAYATGNPQMLARFYRLRYLYVARETFGDKVFSPPQSRKNSPIRPNKVHCFPGSVERLS